MTNDTNPPPVSVRLGNVVHWAGRIVVAVQLVFMLGPPTFGHKVSGDLIVQQLVMIAVTVGVYSALDYLITGRRRI